jgi:hypothetical protein
MKMKKSILAITAFVLLALVSIPAYSSISGTTWLGTAFRGTDTYYSQDIVAYRTGSTAVLKVTVTNTEGTAINLTKVWVTFDWGASYVSTEVNATATGRITIRNGEIRVIFINFTVPDISVASNLYTHSYVITANFTGGLPPYTTSGNNFAIYSTDQADAMNLADIIASFPQPSSWQSAQAQILVNEAKNETATAARYYQQGNFGTAKQSYNNALNDLNQAWNVEQSYLTTLQDLQIQQTQAQIRSLDAMTSFFNGLSTMWVLFGIGWVLLGLGYIVKWLRKRPEPQIATA